jgi:hypothetical protein
MLQIEVFVIGGLTLISSGMMLLSAARWIASKL